MPDQSSDLQFPFAGWRAGFALALLAFACNASSDATFKWLSADYAVVQIIFFMALSAFLPVLAVSIRRNRRQLRTQRPYLVALRAVLNAATAFTGLYAVSRISLAEVYTILFSAPLAVTAIAALTLGERHEARRWLAVLFGFAGVVVALRPGFGKIDIGHAAALATMLIYAIQFVLLRHLTRSEHDGVLAGSVLAAMVVLSAPVLPFVYRPVVGADWGLLALAGLLIGFTNVAIAAAARRAPAGVLAPAQYSLIFWALGFDFLIFGAAPEMFTLLGAAMIVAAVLTNFRERRESLALNPFGRRPGGR